MTTINGGWSNCNTAFYFIPRHLFELLLENRFHYTAGKHSKRDTINIAIKYDCIRSPIECRSKVVMIPVLCTYSLRSTGELPDLYAGYATLKVLTQ